MTLKQVRVSAFALSPHSRRKLAWELLHSVEEKLLHECPQGALSDSDPTFLAILDQRIADFESGKDPGITWEKVRARMVKKFNTGQTPHRSRPRTRSSR